MSDPTAPTTADPVSPTATQPFWLPEQQQEPVPPAGRAAGPAPGRGGTVALVLATALLAGGVGGGIGVWAAGQDDGTTAAIGSTTPSTTTRTVLLPDSSIEKVAADVLPSVVSIQVRAGQSSGSGSGVILSADGLVLTNNHVVEAAASGGSLTVTLQDGRSFDATLVGRDPGSDLAVIRATDASGLDAAKLGSSADLVVGQTVVAIGSPLGLSGTVTSGIVSAKNRPVVTDSDATGEGAVLDAIQTDAAINPGNSGGALVNLQGEVVGINSAIATLSSGGGQSGSIGLGFAIPIDQAKRIADEILESGTASRAQLGVTVGDAEGGGARIGEVTSGGAADRAGLRSGDVVRTFGDRVIDSADALVAAVRSATPGAGVPVTYERDGTTATVTVTLGSVQG